MTRKFTNLSLISNTNSSQSPIREGLASSRTTLNEEVTEEVVIANECLKLHSTTCEDYKKMYDECERKLAEHNENFQKQLIQFANDYDELKEENDKLKKNYNELKKSQEDWKAEKEVLISKYETAINEKDADIASQQELLEKIREGASTTQLGFNKISNNEDIFRMKSKIRKGRTLMLIM